MPYDLLIHNGTVIDGAGHPRFSANVAIENDRVVAVGAVSGSAKHIIDAAGRIVAPGFIDVHSHDDFALLDRPLCDFKIMQGVTTEVIGNCGFGAAPELFQSAILSLPSFTPPCQISHNPDTKATGGLS